MPAGLQAGKRVHRGPIPLLTWLLGGHLFTPRPFLSSSCEPTPGRFLGHSPGPSLLPRTILKHGFQQGRQ